MLGPPSPCPAWQVTRGEGPAMLGQRSPSRCLCSACRSPSRCLRVLFELGALFGLRSRLAQRGRPAVLGLQSPSRCLGVRRCLACRSPSRCLRVLFELGALFGQQSRPDFNTPWQVARSGGPAVLGSLEVLSAGAGAAVATGPGVISPSLEDTSDTSQHIMFPKTICRSGLEHIHITLRCFLVHSWLGAWCQCGLGPVLSL